ncbi:hypothetical protein KBZ10_11535 [Streptomyces sp. F63]|uniref:hypothetical protein n=1 Tax=Streptomyces sp. F63 TaxID=2824887 RepID=UPI001B392AEB|nr:hypothetical protein [Streptomyces sp. F63]MBQ0985141.1 hypothetical protein [Streptomyces sp. F63]
MPLPERTYTPAERRRRAVLLARTTKQAVADAVSPRLNAEIDRIDAAAEERALRERLAMGRELEAAKEELAAARVAERCAARPGRAAAKQARKAAEDRLRRAERAARR